MKQNRTRKTRPGSHSNMSSAQPMSASDLRSPTHFQDSRYSRSISSERGDTALNSESISPKERELSLERVRGGGRATDTVHTWVEKSSVSLFDLEGNPVKRSGRRTQERKSLLSQLPRHVVEAIYGAQNLNPIPN